MITVTCEDGSAAPLHSLYNSLTNFVRLDAIILFFAREEPLLNETNLRESGGLVFLKRSQLPPSKILSNSSFKLQLRNVAVQWVPLLHCIREVFGSDRHPPNRYPDMGFHSSSQPFQANTGTAMKAFSHIIFD